MGKRTVEIVLISAESLTRQYYGQNPMHPMVVSAGAYITNDVSTPGVQYTSRDHVGDVNPRWNQAFYFTLKCSLGKSRESLVIELYNTTPDGMSTLSFGEVRIPVSNFLESSGMQATSRLSAGYPVSTGGVLRLSYKLGQYKNIASAIFGNRMGASITGLTASVAAGVIGHEINNQLDDYHNDHNDDYSNS